MPRLAAIHHRTYGVNPDYPAFPGLTDLFAERLAPYGVSVDTDAPLAGNRNSYSRMSAHLLPVLTGGVKPDVVVLAHCLPDCDLSTSVAGYLEQLVTGQPLVVAVTEQGRTTPFAALRVAQDLFQAGGHQRIAVLALDQGTFVYADPALYGVDRSTDHAVGMLLTADGPIRIGPTRHLTQVAPHRVTAVLAAELDGLSLHGDVTLVAGAGVPAVCRPYRRRTASAAQLCTGVWSELAAELTGPGAAGVGAAGVGAAGVGAAGDGSAGRTGRPRRTVLAVEYEPSLGYLCLAAFDVPPSEGVLP